MLDENSDGGATDSGEAAGAGHNSFDPKAAVPFIERIESVQDEIDTIMADARDACAPHRDDIKEIKREAADAGIPRKELNAVVSRRRKLRAAEKVREALTEEQQDNFDNILHALGDLADTPLGEAAQAAAA